MPSARQRGKTWTANFRDADGHQRSAGTYPTKAQALRAARAAKALGQAPAKPVEVYKPGKPGRPTVAAYAAEWLPSHRLSPHARDVYAQILRKHILPEIGDLLVADVRPATIRTWFRRLEDEGKSASLFLKIKTVASSMFQTAAEDNVVSSNPVRGVRIEVPPVKRRRALTIDEWRRMRRYISEPWRLRCDIVLETGARVEEVMGIQGADVENGMLHIRRTRQMLESGEFITRPRTKSGVDRDVPVSRELAERIRARGNGPTFPDIRRDTFSKTVWRPAVKAAELGWIPAPHDLRRSFATWARAQGCDLEQVRIALGHTRLATTDIYLSERPEAATEAHRAVQRALGAAEPEKAA